MRIVMRCTVMGARDGYVHPERFAAGETHEVEGDLLRVFLEQGWAVAVDDTSASAPQPELEPAPALPIAKAEHGRKRGRR